MTLKNIISFNKEFKSGINLYLSLNKPEKVNSYIPTSSSLRILNDYLKSTLTNKEQATLLIGPYGKGKSHLLLVLLAVLSMERNPVNGKLIDNLIDKINVEDELNLEIKENLSKAWETKPFLPVVLNSTNGDLNQAFLNALNDSLQRAGLNDLVPDTYYSLALQRLNEWCDNYHETYEKFKDNLDEYGTNIDELTVSLKRFSSEALAIFKLIYPKVTAGSEFNPLASSEVLPLYKDISERLVEDYGYSGVYIVFDEFSKFIEGQDGKLAGNNMKLLQDICELAVDSPNAKVFITLIAHKSIKEYGKYLTQDTINAFTGIEGRIIEKYFVTSTKNNYELVKNAIIKSENYVETIPEYNRIFSEKNIDKYYSIPTFKAKFKREDFENIIFKGCYPLNPIASYLLLHISEKVAQNERTLFTFISNDEPNSLARFVNNHTENDEWIVGANLIYDYFKGIFKKDVSNELVHSVWLSTEYALEKCESSDEVMVVKALATILAVNKEDELPATDSIIKLAIDVNDYQEAIEGLRTKGLIYKKKTTGTYAFKTKSGSALKQEIKRRRGIKGDNVNYQDVLTKIFDNNFVIPRKYNTENKITRYFDREFMSVEAFLDINDAKVLIGGALDGKVLQLYSFEKISQSKIQKHYENLACDQLIVIMPKEVITMQDQMRDYEILQELRASTLVGDDDVLFRELPLIEDDIVQEVLEEIEGCYGEHSDASVLFFNSKDNKIYKDKPCTEEKAVNICCENLFGECPVINNEIVNRSEINSPQTKKSRIAIINALLGHNDSEDFYKGTNQEATIYRSLFVRTGITGNKSLPDKKLLCVLNIINEYIDNCSDNKTSFKQLISTLTTKPYGIRKGVLPLYFAFVVRERREDLIFYMSGMEIQLDANVIINIIDEPAEYELYVSKEDVAKEKYIVDLNDLFQVSGQRNLSENRIKNITTCMQRWYRSLPQVSRNLADCNILLKDNKVSNYMKGIKKLLQRAEINPYEMLFVSLPEVFETDDFSVIKDKLDEVVTNFDDYLDRIINKVTQITYEVFGAKKDKKLIHLLKEWYEKQSSLSKEGLHDGKITILMSFINELDNYNDNEIAKKVGKVITDVYIDDWTDGAINNYRDELTGCKSAIEQIKDDNGTQKAKLTFKGTNGKTIEKYYDKAPEGTGMVLRNIIEDALDEYDDLSVNDRVSILLDMIEKIIG